MIELTVEQKAECWDKFESLAQDLSTSDLSGNSLMLTMLLREIKAQIIIDKGD